LLHAAQAVCTGGWALLHYNPSCCYFCS
jgi:hypothetical protein